MTAVHTHIIDRFPTTDPLAILLASLRTQYDPIVVLISRRSPQADWLLRERRVQRAIFIPVDAHPFVLIFTDTEAMPEWIRERDQPYVITSALETMQETVLRIIALREEV